MRSEAAQARVPARRLSVLLVGLALAFGACGGDDDPAMSGQAEDHNDADVAFAQGMIPHHRQAIEMANLATEMGERPEVKDLARRIREAQGPEIETMQRWLRDWGVADEGDAAMQGHGGGEGMMTEAQMQELMAASGPQFDRLFLESMIRHHRGAVTMAETEVQRGQFGPAKELAQGIIDSQQAEIQEMQSLLAS